MFSEASVIQFVHKDGGWAEPPWRQIPQNQISPEADPSPDGDPPSSDIVATNAVNGMHPTGMHSGW